MWACSCAYFHLKAMESERSNFFIMSHRFGDTDLVNIFHLELPDLLHFHYVRKLAAYWASKHIRSSAELHFLYILSRFHDSSKTAVRSLRALHVFTDIEVTYLLLCCSTNYFIQLHNTFHAWSISMSRLW